MTPPLFYLGCVVVVAGLVVVVVAGLVVVVVAGLVVAVVAGLVVTVVAGLVVVVVASFAAFLASCSRALFALFIAFWHFMLHCGAFVLGIPRNPSVIGAIIMHVTKSITKRNIIERIIPLSNMVVMLYKILTQ